MMIRCARWAGLLLPCLLAACTSTHRLNQQSAETVRTHGSDIRITVAGEPEEIRNRLSGYLKQGLMKYGYRPVDEDRATQLEVAISEFNPGNAFFRFLISGGAGRGTLSYRAIYSKDGRTLVDYQGDEHFVGTEPHPGTKRETLRQFSLEATATDILLEEATKHIVDLAVGKQPED